MITSDDIAKVHTFDALVSLLRDKLEWPIPDDYGFDDVVYEYEPKELGLKPEETAKIREIHQLRPLVTDQPWGVFFVSFEEKSIPVVVLRRVLRALVVKKRAGPKSAERAAWDRHDLLFISAFGKGGARELSFAHFADGAETNDLPVLKVLGWNALDTQRRTDYVAKMLSQRLHWPEDPNDAAKWRETWAGAFELGVNQVVRTSKELSVALAQLAANIRGRANQLLAAEAENGPMRALLKAFRENLIEGLTEDDFADMFAQTISYGLLAARISRPAGLVADNLADMIPNTNPFLKDLFETFLKLGGREKRKDMDFDELGVRDVVDMLNRANMEAVLRDFGDRNPKEDPVIHFYELFLKEYDPKKRMQRGVFYTPRPVVNFIVRGVDEVLRTEFGLPLGLADTTTWEELAAKNDKITIPAHVDPKAPFVQILDPATGTGTFLVEVIDLIHARMVETWKRQGKRDAEINAAWNEYVPQHLLPRLTGYELMMAPYAIAHMKVGLKLGETGYRFGSSERARIFLTNALEAPRNISEELEFISEALSHEATAANESKAHTSTTVIIGNPPYANYSANLSEVARRIVDSYRTFRGSPIRERNQLQFERNIQDDFVKFLAVGQRTIASSRFGVLAFITNSTILLSPSLRGLREQLVLQFDQIREINLHGGVNEIIPGVTLDENVFEIAQAVAIHLYARTTFDGETAIRYCDDVGSRTQKYDHLLSRSLEAWRWIQVIPDPENYTFAPSDMRNDDLLTIRLGSIFEKYGAGVKTSRDAIAVAFDELSLLSNVGCHFPALVEGGVARRNIQSIAYRPFDDRYIFYHRDTVASQSLPTMQHMLAGANLAMLCSGSWTTPSRFSVGSTALIAEMKVGTHDRGTTLFPLYRYERILNGPLRQVANFRRAFIDQWSRITGLRFNEGEQDDCDTSFRPNNIFCWIYAVCHSHEYRRRFLQSLAQGFPIVLFPASVALFNAVSGLGQQLVDLHALKANGNAAIRSPSIRFAGHGEARVEKGYPKFENGKVMINATRWFEDVPRETWEFHVGGYQVCEKWLKDRAATGGQKPKPGRVLTDEDILHYRRVVVALTETRRIMVEIDRVIDAHGGWPGAFVAAKDAAIESDG